MALLPDIVDGKLVFSKEDQIIQKRYSNSLIADKARKRKILHDALIRFKEEHKNLEEVNNITLKIKDDEDDDEETITSEMEE